MSLFRWWNRGWRLSRLMADGRLVWRLLWDPRVPLARKLLVPGAMVYVVSPLDLIPDVIPLFGQVDDVVVVLMAFRLFLALVPRDVLAEHRRAMAGGGGPAGEGDPSSQQGSQQGPIIEGSYRVLEDDEGAQ